MIKIKNIAPGPRGLNTKEGPVMLARGQEATVDLDDKELASSKKTGWFAFEGESAKEVASHFDTMSDDELRALLKDKGIAADGRWGHDKLVAEAKKAAE